MTTPADDRFADRHPATTGLLRWFDASHLSEDLRDVSEPIGELARDLAEILPDGPELTTGLRKLLEAKDCLVRAAIEGTITRSRPWVAPNARGEEIERGRPPATADVDAYLKGEVDRPGDDEPDELPRRRSVIEQSPER